jgi:hypothetical protein
MSTPKHVLLVTNAVTETEIALIRDALEQAKKDSMPIKLSLVHVIPNLPTCYFNIPSMVTLAERYYDEAKKCLTTLGNTLGITKENQWLITGRIKNEVLRLADKLDAHFILASSPNIQDFHKSFAFKFKKEPDQSIVKNITAISSL